MQTSIRLRLTVWYVAALLVTLLLLGSAVFLLTRAGLYHWLDEGLAERAEALSDEVKLAGPAARPALPESKLSLYTGSDDGFALYDGNGALVTAGGLDVEHLGASRAVTASLAGRPGTDTTPGLHDHAWRLAARPVLANGKAAAVVIVGHDLDEVDEVLERVGWSMLFLLPIGLAGAGLGGYGLAGRALAPVAGITAKAAQISERDLSERLPVRSKDELGRLAITFNAMIGRLQEAFERQRRFTADASHELRTPLAVIRAVSSQKLMQRRQPEEYEQALQQIDEAAEYMTRLVGQLLTLARVDAGDAPLERERVELVELLEHVAAQVGEAAGRRIPVRAAGPVTLHADPVRLTQLFLNLLENAAKYTPPNGVVEVRVAATPSEVSVVVRDTGVGISPEHLPHVFERFYRVDKARAREEGGTGLGLSIAQWIAHSHGGSLRAESEPGRGTAMIVTLPKEGAAGEP